MPILPPPMKPIATATNGNDNQQSHPNPALSEAELSSLEQLDRDGLIKLIRKVYSAGWGSKGLTGEALVKTALRSNEEVYEALMLRAATLAENATDDDLKMFETLTRFWVEQTKGKPVQRIQQNTTISIEDMIIQAYRKPLLIEQVKDDGIK